MTPSRRPEEWAEGDDVAVGDALGWPGGASGRVMGRGRRGVTVRATQPDGTVVAVKVAPALRSERARRRHAEDASVLRGVEPGRYVAGLLASGVGPAGHPWETTPWYGGGSLADRLARGPLPADRVGEVAVCVGLGLAELHRQGVLHANLRPGNLLAGPGPGPGPGTGPGSRPGADGDVVLTGMAVDAVEDPAAEPVPPAAAADMASRLAHLPPEVIEGRPWTVAGDIWALGSCLHTLVSGRPPWAREAADGPAALVLAMATGRSPGLRPAGTPAWLAALIDGCLAVDESARPADGSTVAAMARHRVDDRLDTLFPDTGPSEGTPLGSSYLLDDPLGSGSSGLVWRGHRRWDGKPVAVKILRPELADDPDAVARFLRERTTLVGLDHPNLVPIMDLVAEGSTLAIVMELVEGHDLRQVLRQDGALHASEACRLLGQTASGVAAVHAAGIVHRDLKPENILVQGTGPDRRARVTDFGIARAATGTSLTRTDQLIGTAEYLAPELVAGRPVTPASDIYSLGVLGYELLSGRRPFEAEHPAALLQAHLERDPAPLGGIPDGAWDLISRAMAKDPGERPDATELAAQLEFWAPRVRGADVRPIDVGPTSGSTPAAPRAPSGPLPSPGAPVWTPPPAPLPTPTPDAAPTAAHVRPGTGCGAPAPPADADERWRPAAAVAATPPAPPSDDRFAPPPGAGTEARPTEAWSSWRSRPPPGPGGAAEAPTGRRSRRGQLIAALVAVVVLGVGGGVAYALTRPAPKVASYTSVDVTSAVTLTGPGTVKVQWTPLTGRPGLQFYVLTLNHQYNSQYGPSTPPSVTLQQQPPTYTCFQVRAEFQGPAPTGVPHLADGSECTTPTT